MTSHTVRLDSTGRVLIPVAVRRALGLGAGSDLLLRLREGGFELMTVSAAVREAQRLVRKRVPTGRKLVDDLLRERRREAKRG